MRNAGVWGKAYQVCRHLATSVLRKFRRVGLPAKRKGRQHAHIAGDKTGDSSTVKGYSSNFEWRDALLSFPHESVALTLPVDNSVIHFLPHRLCFHPNLRLLIAPPHMLLCVF